MMIIRTMMISLWIRLLTALKNIIHKALAVFTHYNLEQAILEANESTMTDPDWSRSIILNSSPQLNQLIKLTLIMMARIVPYDAADIMLLDQETNRLRLAGCRGYAGRGFEDWIRSLDLSPTDRPTFSQMLKTGRPLAIPDTRISPDWMKTPETDWIRAYVGAPLQVDGQIIGFLNLANETPHTLTQAQAACLQGIADQVAMAIKNARSFEKSQLALSRTEVLYQISRTITASPDLPTLLQSIVDTVAQTLPANRVLLITFEMIKRQVSHYYKGGPGAARLSQDSFAELQQGLTGWVMQHQESILSLKGEPDQRESETLQKRRQETEGGSIIVVPMNYQGNILGTLTIINRLDQPDFNQQDLELVEAIAGHITPAIENARLHNQTQQELFERKQAEAALRESEARYRDLFENANDLIQSVGADGYFNYVNRRWSEATGYSPEEATQLHFEDILHPEQISHCRALFAQMGQGLAVGRIETIFVTKTGRPLMVEGDLSAQQVDGKLIATRGIFRDITERKTAEEAVRFQKTLLESQGEASPDGIAIVSDTGRYIYYNRRFIEMWDLPESVIKVGISELALQAVKDKLIDPDHFLAQIAHLYDHYDEADYEEIALKDGRIFDRFSSPVQSPDGVYYGRAWYYRDISERKRSEALLAQRTQDLADSNAELAAANKQLQSEILQRLQVQKQLKYDALHDALTGLPNRALFMENLTTALRQANQDLSDLSHQFAVLFLDLDRFKLVNDTLGHLVGDQLLMAVARRLEDAVRPGDTVARLGGDEFTILLENIENTHTATRVAEKVLTKLAEPVKVDDQELFTGTSVGIVLGPAGYERPEDLLRDADTALYEVKSRGKGQYILFDAEMYAQLIARLQLEHDLRQALEKQDFLVYYQPIISLTSGQIVGAEAFLRWQHPQRGLLNAGEFIDLAEETRLIIPLGQWLLRTVCDQIHAWHLAGYTSLRISVNVSAHQFHQQKLTTLIDQILADTQLPPKALELEVSESLAVKNNPYIVTGLQTLSSRGVQIAMDDYGTGHSTLEHLRHTPFNTLKIDRSLLKDIITDPNRAMIVMAMINLAHNLGLSVAAIGVETEEQLAFLQAQQCDEVQGYLFREPISAEAFTDLLDQKTAYLDPRDLDQELDLAVRSHVQQTVGYALVDENLIILSSNESFNSWTEEEDMTNLIGQPLPDIFPELIGVEDLLQQLAHHQGEPFSISKIYRSGDQQTQSGDFGRYLDLYIEPFLGSKNTLLVMVTEVTEQALAEFNLRQELNKLRLRKTDTGS